MEKEYPVKIRTKTTDSPDSPRNDSRVCKICGALLPWNYVNKKGVCKFCRRLGY